MERFKEIFYIDYRSLRLFRFGLGIYAVIDIVNRTLKFEAFFSEHGILPSHLVEKSSLFLLSNSPLWTGFLFLCVLFSGGLLICNRYPRLASFAAFALALSLRNRNLFINYGADDLFRVCLLWSALLPSGPSREGETKFSSLASFAALGQLVILYLSAGLSKSPGNWFFSPNATYVALSSDTYAKPITRLILDQPLLLKFSAISIFLIERFGWLMFFSPWRQAEWRLLGFFVFAGMHLIFGTFLHLELFPLIDITLLTLILPDKFWDRLKVESLPTIRRFSFEPALQAMALCLFAVLFYVAISISPAINSPPSQVVRRALSPFGLYTTWSMFYPIESMSDSYYRVLGRTDNGEWVDEINQQTLSNFPPKPIDPQSEMGGFLWTRYFESLSAKPEEKNLKALIDYFCRRWTPDVAGAKTREITLYQFIETTIVAELPVASTMRTLFTGPCAKD